ncbi:MAG: PAS domain S-box protein, partial [Methylococcaceae bacterium]
IVFYNRRFVDMWNIPEELVRAGLDQPVLQTTMKQVIDPEKFLSRIEYLYEHREEKSHEEMKLKDGRIVDRYSSAVVGSEGQYYGRVWYFRDISERKQAESILRESEERFRMAFQNSAIGMALVEVDGRWLKVNDALCRILGYAEQELLRKTFQDITHPDDLESDLNFVAQLLAGKIDHYQMEKRYFHKDGHAVWVLLSVSLLRDTKGNPIHFISQIEDITKDKQAKEKIRNLNEVLEIRVQERTRQLLDAYEELVGKEKLALLGQVAGSVGHELRNPLGVMSNAVYFLQTVLSDADQTTREYLDIIKSEIATSERIVGDLLDSVRTKPPRPELAGVPQLIEQSLGKCTIPPSVTVKLDIPESLPPLRVDAMQICQVFRNLISNGMEAMPEGGALEIRALDNEMEKQITVNVHDTGIGMTPEQQAKLFQPLFTTKARGIGLGLVVVKNLTEANGGRIEVQSEAGKGTMFSVTFPYEMENWA